MAAVNSCVRRYLSTNAVKYAKTAVRGPSAVSGGHGGGYKVWRNLTLFVALPTCIVCAANCYFEHVKGHEERPPHIKYEYMYIRTKRFPWGDGNHSLFHNPHLNALPDGYEE